MQNMLGLERGPQVKKGISLADRKTDPKPSGSHGWMEKPGWYELAPCPMR